MMIFYNHIKQFRGKIVRTALSLGQLVLCYDCLFLKCSILPIIFVHTDILPYFEQNVLNLPFTACNKEIELQN